MISRVPAVAMKSAGIQPLRDVLSRFSNHEILHPHTILSPSEYACKPGLNHSESRLFLTHPIQVDTLHKGASGQCSCFLPFSVPVV